MGQQHIDEGGPPFIRPFEGGPPSPLGLVQEVTPVAGVPFSAAGSPIVTGTAFPSGGWDPVFKAWAIASAFGANASWITECDPGAPDDTQAALDADVASLLQWVGGEKGVSGRLLRRAEILAQAADVTPYWMHLLAASASSRPATFDLVKIGLHVGGLVGSYFKLKYMRARPVQVCAAVLPAIMTPGHPSYPSGHALQAFIVADCIALAAPVMAATCKEMADRIAQNREIAGIHFPSDTAASRKIAPYVVRLLKDVPLFVPVLDAAKKEWLGAVAHTRQER